YQQLDPHLVRLEHVGAPAKQLQFFDHTPDRRGFVVPRIHPARLYRRLQKGWTLVIDGTEALDPRFGALCDDMSARFSNDRTIANLYASFGHSPGFPTHWDG